MLGSVDEKVKNFLMILQRKGGVVNSVVVIAAAQSLIQQSPEEHQVGHKVFFDEWALPDECAPQTSLKSLY